MCASYGLDPRFTDAEYRDAVDAAILDGLHSWAEDNGGTVLRPTGKNARNVNPLLPSMTGYTLGWWGYLVDGAPAPFASINSRSERLSRGAGPLPARALVPASHWREMAKPARQWHHFAGTGNEVLMMAAVIRPGRTADGAEYTCYSILTQPAAPHLTHIHDRMPVVIPAGFAEEWLAPGAAERTLIDAAVAASRAHSERISPVAIGTTTKTGDTSRLF